MDEAAPPKGLRAVSERLIERGITTTWWGNIRFERKMQLEEVIRLLKESKELEFG